MDGVVRRSDPERAPGPPRRVELKGDVRLVEDLVRELSESNDPTDRHSMATEKEIQGPKPAGEEKPT